MRAIMNSGHRDSHRWSDDENPLLQKGGIMNLCQRPILVCVFILLSATSRADSIQLRDGQTIRGTVVAYDAKERTVTIREKRGRGEGEERRFTAVEYHAITISGDAPMPTEKQPPLDEATPEKPALAKGVIPWGKTGSHGRLKAKIHKVVIERAPLRYRHSQEHVGPATSPDLIVYWTITDTDDRLKIGYEHNVLGQKGEAFLFDDIGQNIRGMGYGIYQHTYALKDVDDILPGETKWHITPFTIPPPKTKALTVKLDLAPFGIGKRELITGAGDTHLTFDIPLDKIENYPHR